MTGVIDEADLGHPAVKALSEIICSGCLTSPIGVGTYVAKSRHRRGSRGSPGHYETRLFHAGCAWMWRCRDQIGARDEPLCEGK